MAADYSQWVRNLEELIGYWRMIEPYAGHADLSGSGLHLRKASNATFSHAGPVVGDPESFAAGNSISFGWYDNAGAPHLPFTKNPGECTIAMSVKMGGTAGNWSNLFNTGWTSLGSMLLYESSSSLIFGAVDQVGSQRNASWANVALLRDGSWHRVVCRLSGGGTSIQLWVDGVLRASATTANPFTTLKADYQFFMGSCTAACTVKMAEVWVTDRAISDDEIAADLAYINQAEDIYPSQAAALAYPSSSGYPSEDLYPDTTPIVPVDTFDDFERADENPIAGWTVGYYGYDSGHAIVGGYFENGGAPFADPGKYGFSHNDESMANPIADAEAWFEIGDTVANSTGYSWMDLRIRYGDGGVANTESSWAIAIEKPDVNTPWTWHHFCQEVSVDVYDAGGYLEFAPLPGDKFGVRSVGNLHTVWHQRAGTGVLTILNQVYNESRPEPGGMATYQDGGPGAPASPHNWASIGYGAIDPAVVEATSSTVTLTFGEPDALVLRDPDLPRASWRTVEATIRLLSPDGKWINVGTDLSRGIVHEDLTYSHRDGSPDTCGFILRRDPAIGWPDLAAFNRAHIEVGGLEVWSGRVREAPGQSGSSTQISFQGLGWKYHGDDDLIHRGYVHQNLRTAIDARSVPRASSANAQPPIVRLGGESIAIGFENGIPYTAGTRVGVRFDFGEHHPGIKQAAISCWGINPNGFTTLYIRGHSAPDGASSPAYYDFGGGLSFGSVSGTATSPTLHGGVDASGDTWRYLTIFLFVTPGSGTTGMDHILNILRVICSSNSAYESGVQSLLNADDVVRDVLTSGALPLLVQDQAEIESTSFVIPEYWPAEARTPNEHMAAVNAFHDYLLGVDVDRRLFFRARPTVPELEVGPWAGADFSDGSAGSADDVYSKAIITAENQEGSAVELIRYAADAAPDLAALVDVGGISNGFFTTNTVGWTTLVGTFARAALAGYDGVTGMAKFTSDLSGNSAASTSVTNLEVGSTYAVRFRYRAFSAGGTNVTMAAQVDGASDTIGGMQSVDVGSLASTAWFLGQVTFVADATTATLILAMTSTILVSSDLGYIDNVSVVRVEATVVDRNGFQRATRIPVSATLTVAAAEEVANVWLRERITTPFKGSVVVSGAAGVRRVKGGASVPPYELPLHTDKRIRVATMEDPDTGAWGRVGTVRSCSYSFKTGQATMEIDNERHRVEALLERLAVVTGQIA